MAQIAVQTSSFAESLQDRSGKVVPLPVRNITKSPFVSRPIYSYGFIVRALNTNRWLLVRRLYTVEYQLIMRGSFRIGNLPSLLNCLSSEEREILGSCCYEGKPNVGLIHLVIQKIFPKADSHDKNYSLIRLQEAAPIIHSILSSRSDTGSNEWLWPKGQQRLGEEKIKCAIREFHEEVGHELPTILRNASFQPREKIVTSTGRQFESTYWICLIAEEFPLTQPESSETEIGERRWVSDDEAITLLNSQRREIFLKAKEWANSVQKP